nr:signal recognition particle receptor subunit alpha [Betaproteobacteria bacterium]
MFSFFKSKKKPAESDTNVPANPESELTSESESKSQPESEPETKPESTSFASKLRLGLSRTRQNLGKQLTGLFSGGKIDEELYDELETILLTADTGVTATNLLLEDLRKQVKREDLTDATQL